MTKFFLGIDPGVRDGTIGVVMGQPCPVATFRPRGKVAWTVLGRIYVLGPDGPRPTNSLGLAAMVRFGRFRGVMQITIVLPNEAVRYRVWGVGRLPGTRKDGITGSTAIPGLQETLSTTRRADPGRADFVLPAGSALPGTLDLGPSGVRSDRVVAIPLELERRQLARWRDLHTLRLRSAGLPTSEEVLDRLVSDRSHFPGLDDTSWEALRSLARTLSTPLG